MVTLLRNGHFFRCLLIGLWCALPFVFPSVLFLLISLAFEFPFVLKEKPLLNQYLLVFACTSLEHIEFFKLAESVGIKKQCRLLRVRLQLLIEFGCLVASALDKHGIEEVTLVQRARDILLRMAR